MHHFLSGNLIIPLLFGLRGQNIRGLLDWMMEAESWSPEQLVEFSENSAWKMVHRAYSQLEFYQDHWKELGNPRREEIDWCRIPTLDKEDVRRLAASISSGGRLAYPHLVRRTSGTTGSPVEVYTDYRTHAMCLAARFRALGWHGIPLGGNEGRFWSGNSRRSYGDRVREVLFNRVVFTPSDLTDEGWSRGLGRLRRSRPKYLYGYFSLLERFGELVFSHGIDLKALGVEMAIVTAEMSTESERSQLAKSLNVPVVNEYGSSEVDIIAFACPAGGLHVQSENVLVEVMGNDEGDNREGEILVTDLNNQFMPLIRYKLGDWVAMAGALCECGRNSPVLTRVDGRSNQRFVVTGGGRKIHVTEIVDCIKVAGGGDGAFSGFHIRQLDSGTVEICWDLTGSARDAAVAESELASSLEKLEGDDLEFRIVQAEGVQSRGDGKRSYFTPFVPE